MFTAKIHVITNKVFRINEPHYKIGVLIDRIYANGNRSPSYYGDLRNFSTKAINFYERLFTSPFYKTQNLQQQDNSPFYSDGDSYLDVTPVKGIFTEQIKIGKEHLQPARKYFVSKFDENEGDFWASEIADIDSPDNNPESSTAEILYDDYHNLHSLIYIVPTN